MKGPISVVELDSLVHATEDLDKVVSAIGRLLPSKTPTKVDEMDGHWGNRISRINYRFSGDEANKAFGALIQGMGEEEKSKLTTDLQSYVDEHGILYMRLNKQDLVSGNLVLGSTDPVRVTVRPRVYLKKGTAPDFYREIIMGGK